MTCMARISLSNYVTGGIVIENEQLKVVVIFYISCPRLQLTNLFPKLRLIYTFAILEIKLSLITFFSTTALIDTNW